MLQHAARCRRFAPPRCRRADAAATRRMVPFTFAFFIAIMFHACPYHDASLSFPPSLLSFANITPRRCAAAAAFAAPMPTLPASHCCRHITAQPFHAAATPPLVIPMPDAPYVDLAPFFYVIFSRLAAAFSYYFHIFTSPRLVFTTFCCFIAADTGVFLLLHLLPFREQTFFIELY